MIDQAEGLLDWHRLQELEGQEYLDEDESWELHSLRDKYDCHPPRIIHHDRPFTYEEYLHFQGRLFSARIWADEVVMAYKHNLIMGGLLHGKPGDRSGDTIQFFATEPEEVWYQDFEASTGLGDHDHAGE